MNSKRYWKNRLPFLLTNLVCMAALTVFLLVCGNLASAVVLILIVWALILLMGLVLTYWERKRQMKKLLDMAKQLSERYLISEVMELPEQAEDQVYYQILKMAGKSMLEQIGEVERERLEYKEYIEQWIHEIKTPITAMKLLCENHRTNWTKELLLELEKTNRFTEQALYYARSEHTEKDYSVREMALSQVVHRYCKISFLLRFQTSASCKAHVLGECPFPCTDAALGNRRCCFTQKNRVFPISLRTSGWCCIDRYPDFFHRRTGKSLLPWI